MYSQVKDLIKPELFFRQRVWPICCMSLSAVSCVMFLFTGCASVVLKSPIEGERLNQLRYGMTMQQVVEQIGHTGKPLFRFVESGKSYDVRGYRPSTCHYAYVFVYENSRLSSVMNTDHAKSVWKKQFSDYGNSLPSAEQFGAIVQGIAESRVDLQKYPLYDESACGKPESNDKDRFYATLLEAGVIYAWVPGLREALLGTGVVLIPIEEMTRAEQYRSTVLQLDANAAYLAFVEKLDSLPWGATQADVMKALGSPHRTITTGLTELLIYKTQFNVIIGLEKQEMKWIAYDYAPKSLN